VIVRLRRRKSSERVKQFRADRAEELRQLARKIARWTVDNRNILIASDPETGSLLNRPADNWRPLLAIADAAGGDWPTIARATAEASEGLKQDQSSRAILLSDIREVFESRPHVDRIASTELAAELGAMEGRPWAEWRNGKPITAASLARMLAPFGISPATRRDGPNTFKGYLFANFSETFDCYLGNQTVTPSQLNNDGHCDALQPVTAKTDVTLLKSQKSNNDGHCDGVTLSAGIDPDGWTFNLEEVEQ
jgi:hypothetical protein